jgi:hypothetical protein
MIPSNRTSCNRRIILADLVERAVRFSSAIFCALCGKSSALDVRPLLRMSAQIPARLHARVWKEGVHAGLRARRVEDELRLPILLQDGVVMSDDYRTVRIPIRDHAQAEQTKINCKRQKARPENREDCAQKNLPQSISEIGHSLVHDARL